MRRSDFIFKYRVRNWPEYNKALISRGSLTLWVDEQAVSAWRRRGSPQGRGRPRIYSDTAIECALVVRTVFHLSLRATQGFLESKAADGSEARVARLRASAGGGPGQEPCPQPHDGARNAEVRTRLSGLIRLQDSGGGLPCLEFELQNNAQARSSQSISIPGFIMSFGSSVCFVDRIAAAKRFGRCLSYCGLCRRPTA